MKDTKTLLTRYESTDEIAEILQKFGCTIICISYGYNNFCDLIVYEVQK